MKFQEIQDKSNHFKLLFDNAPLPYQSLDKNGCFLTVNKKWLNTLGYEDKKEIIGTRFGEYITPEYQSIFDDNFSRLKQHGMVEEAVFDLIRKDGEVITISLNGRAQYDKDGNLVCTHCVFQDITKPIQTTRQLQESEQRYRRLSDATFESIFISEKGVCIEQNSTAEKMFGYTQEEAIGRMGTEWIVPEHRETVIKNILSGYEAPYEVTALRKDGTTFPCEIQGRTILSKDTTLRITALRNITNRIKAEEKLRDSEERHRLIFENSPLSLVRYDKKGHIIDCNEKFISIMGSSKEKLIGFNALRDCAADIIAPLILAINGQRSEFKGVYTSVTGGKTSYLRAVFNPVTPNNLPSEVIAAAEDVTDRKKMEVQLAKSEKSFRLMADNAQDIIYRFSIYKKKFEYISPSTQKVLGYSADAFYKNASFIFTIAHPDWKKFMAQQWQEMANGQMAPRVEYQIIHKSGQVRWLQQNNIILFNEDGNPTRAEGIVRDITDLKNALERVEHEKSRAEAANRTKSEFLANMSHEIRTPLNGIMGMLQLMQNNAPSIKQTEFIDAAMKASKRLNNVLSDILDLARVEAGKLLIQNTAFNPAQITTQTYDFFELAAKQTGLDLQLNIDPEVPDEVIGDGLRLQQVLSNIIGNALKFTENGNVTIETLKLPYSIPGKTNLLFIVTDTGTGIQEQQLNRLFESFTQTNAGYTREHQGVGLGLAICKRLVKLMGGNISVDSVHGKGSAFYICLPFTNSAAKTKKSSSEPDQPFIIPPGQRVLIAEDEKENRFYIKRDLEQIGFSVDTVSNGQQALEMLTYEDFDIVLMDTQMPIMNGVETTQAIRRGEAGAHNKRMPIIAITSYATLDDRKEIMEAGVDDFIAPPIEQEKLHEIISRAINRYEDRKKALQEPPLQ